MVAYTCNHSTGESGVGEWQVQGQPGLHSKTLSQKKKEKENTPVK
jgi:hypothetical protein